MCMKYSVREVLAHNVRRLMDSEPEEGLKSQVKIAKRSNKPGGKRVAQTAVGYLLRPTSRVSPKLDTITAVAEAFGKEPWQLLHPTMGERVQQAPELVQHYEIANDRDRDIIRRVLNMDSTLPIASDEEVGKRLKPAPKTTMAKSHK